MWELDLPRNAIPIGYRFLVKHFNICSLPHHRWSFISDWESKEIKYDDLNLELRIYPKSYGIGSDPLKHLEFALKHEGIHLNIIRHVLREIGEHTVTNYIKNTPYGKYVRKIWFLYEFLFEQRLAIEDISRGSYVYLLDPKLYYCGKPIKSPRHHIIDNLMGNHLFSPVVRRSQKLQQFEALNLHAMAEDLTNRIEPEILGRAVRFLFAKETMASWEIEREKPDRAKVARFVTLLQRDYSHNTLSKKLLLSIQKEIVDPRFYLDDYRDFQNYVGEEPVPGEVLIHYIAPSPEDLPELMEGLLECAHRLFSSHVDPIVTAAVLSFGFVYMHPFWDGNGRLHRFLIHYVLSKLGFVPDGIIFPISAVILREYKEYDKALESISTPLCELIKDYELNDLGEMSVTQQTIEFYRHMDFTPIAEFLYGCVKQTIQVDLEKEIDFLSRYDEIKRLIKEIVDMPDQQIDLFIKCVRQNNGSLSRKKRDSLFSMLSEVEIQAMESILRRD